MSLLKTPIYCFEFIASLRIIAQKQKQWRRHIRIQQMTLSYVTLDLKLIFMSYYFMSFFFFLMNAYVKFLWFSLICLQLNKDRPLPKFGEWDVNNPASASEFTVIFDKVRDEKKTGGTSSSVSPSPKYTASDKYSHSSKSNNKVSTHFMSLPFVFGPQFSNNTLLILKLLSTCTCWNAEKVVLPLLSCSFGLSLPLKIQRDRRLWLAMVVGYLFWRRGL